MLEDPVAAPKTFWRRHVKYTRPRVRSRNYNYRPRRRSYETRRRYQYRRSSSRKRRYWAVSQCERRQSAEPLNIG